MIEADTADACDASVDSAGPVGLVKVSDRPTRGPAAGEGLRVHRSEVVLRPDPRRVVFRPFAPHTAERELKIVARVMQLSEEDVSRQFAAVLADYGERHIGLREFFLRRFGDYERHVFMDRPLSEERKMLIGSYFTQEYSFECAALFNPSMVWHPDQSGVPEGGRRFIISLRSTGEGHISSISFRTGVIDADFALKFQDPSRFATLPELQHEEEYETALFGRKLAELGTGGDFVDGVLMELGKTFTIHELREVLRQRRRFDEATGHDHADIAEAIHTLAESNYTVEFPERERMSERILFPSTASDGKGLEDTRFVEFTDEDGGRCYYGTYTAYSGTGFIPQLIETRDFRRFHMSTLNGPAVQNKGMAIFPRKVDGRYAVISRQDNENIYLMYSDNIHFWHEKRMLLKPTFPWEYVQLGNCGSPIETDAGWLVLSHGVGPMRKYTIGAFLLDRDDPSKVIGRTRRPILAPDEREREGYVPNVVYSCGGQVWNGRLVIPYAMSDYASSFASVELDALLGELT